MLEDAGSMWQALTGGLQALGVAGQLFAEQVDSMEFGYLLLLFPLLVYISLVLQFHRKGMTWLPGGQTLWGYAFVTFLIITPTAAYVLLYLLMNWTQQWHGLNIMVSLVRGELG